MKQIGSDASSVTADEAIIELYWQRDEAAIRETERKYREYLHTVAWNIVKDDSDCEECLNDTYLHAWNAIPPQRPQSLRAYLTKVVRSLAIDCYRRRTRQKRIPTACTVSLNELSDTLGGGVEDTFTPEAAYKASVIGRVISRYLRTLSERDLTLFVSRYYCSDTIPALAARTGMSESGIKKALLRMREGLRTQLEKEGIEL